MDRDNFRALAILTLCISVASLISALAHSDFAARPNLHGAGAGVDVRLTVSDDQKSVTLAWDPSPGPIGGYLVSYGTKTGSSDRLINVGRSTQATVTLPTPVTTTQYFFVVMAYSTGSNEVSTPAVAQPSPGDDPCALPFGTRAVTATITRYVKTTGAAGSLSRLEYLTLSPNSPITKVSVLLNGLVVRSMGEGLADVTSASGIRFTLPTAPGTYAVSLEASNAAGCKGVSTKDASGKAISVVVK